MKPIRLVMCGWGPYRDQQSIEFEQMEDRGIFLITGATGAGKTTIFDAVMYALYGCMSGEVREKGTVRSDFTSPDVPTYVELWMSHKGEQYQIYRNPEYLRPSRRKSAENRTLTKEKERAVLTLPDGSRMEGSSEVTKKIQEILRLDYRQFKQISMIAQGEFSKMLTSSSQEKTKIFRQIFDTGLYEKIAQILKEQSAGVYKEVLQYRHKMDEDIEMYLPGKETRAEYEAVTQGTAYDYEAVANYLKKEHSRLVKESRRAKQNLEQAEEELLEASAVLAKAQKLKEVFQSLEREEKKQQELDGQQKEMQQYEEKLLKAQLAQKVKQQEVLCEEVLRQLNNKEEQIRSLQKEIEELEQGLKEQQPLYEKRELVEAYLEKQAEWEKRLKDCEQNTELCKQYSEELKKQKAQYLKQEKQELQARQNYEQAELGYRHNLAGILAEDLEDGLPCPVCGSLHHPLPAVSDGQAADADEVERLRNVWIQMREQSMELHGQMMAWQSRVAQEEDKGKELFKQREQLFTELLSYPEVVRRLAEGFQTETFRKELQRIEKLRIRCGEKKEQLCKEEERRNADKALWEERSRKTEQLMMQSGFQDHAQYEQSCMPEDELEQGFGRVEAYRQSCHTNRELIRHLKAQTKGEAVPDLCLLLEHQQEKHSQKKQAQELYAGYQGLLENTDRTYRSLLDKKERLKVLMDQYTLIKGLDDAANGNNKKRLVFEQYVLISYFEEILRAANLRLAAMSSGRYELRRLKGIQDARSKDNLEMEVLDYYTGKYRSVKTLSGGETFKVSLSLALGMSDVVQAWSGGIQVETMFIDEGFGSLDGESLEQACQVLQGLSEGKRLVGIISHVAELAEKIPNQIRVNKTKCGSTIEVVLS